MNNRFTLPQAPRRSLVDSTIELIRGQIEGGAWKVGERIPREQELAEMLPDATYAEVPGFTGWFGSERNNYDKIGHFFQGFVPAILAREILIRKQVVNGSRWLALFVVSVCLAFSAFYELIEWWVAELSGEGAEAFLGTQGYVWDTQSDMALALIGSIIALVILSTIHDRQVKALA